VQANGALESLAGLLPTLPDEAVEGLLVSFDTLVNVSDSETRPFASELLRRVAETGQIPGRRERLLRAADDVAASRPCALTADGMTAAQAAASQTMTQEQWDRHIVEHPLPPPPAESAEDFDEDFSEENDQEDPENPPYMIEEPPKLPDLPVRFFFPGLVLRVARDFADAYGQTVCSTDLIRLINCVHDDVGYAVTCMDRNIRLNEKQAEIIANLGNAWFQPVPSTDCLEELLAAIEDRLGQEEEDEEADPDKIESIRDDIDRCAAWLAESMPRGSAPKCRTGQVATRLFGTDHELSHWVRLLFAAIEVA
jgi:hypothetical protein